MSANMGTYAPENVVIILSNDRFSHTVTGLAEGTFINFERSVPRATLYTGADLHAARVLRRNKSGTITLTLSQHGESNDVFSELARLDEESQSNDWLFSVLVKDLSGRTVFSASQAFLGNDPNLSFGTETEMREWTIGAANIERHIGGDSKFTPENQSELESLGYVVEDRFKMN